MHLNLKWKRWQNKHYMFEQWRQEKRRKPTLRWWAFLRDMFLRQISTLPKSSTGLCLDVGCGTGEYLCRLVKQGQYKGIGLDPLKESSLKVFKHRIEGSNLSNEIGLINAVGEYLPIKEDCVQLCIMTAALDHVNNPNQTLKEIQRVLALDGYFMLLQSVVRTKKPNFKEEMHLNDFTMADLKRLLKPFRIEKIRSLFPIPLRIPLPDKLLGSLKIYEILTRIHGIIASFLLRFFPTYTKKFNYSVAIVKSKP